MASPSLQAQTFQSLPALSFTKVYEGGDPPSQVITAASTGANFQFFASAVDSTGGSWLTISPGGSSGVHNTPRTITVSANPAMALAPGSYAAQIKLTSADDKQVILIPVSLAVVPANTPSIDATSGALTFSMITKGSAPPLQTVPIRNAGNGTLNWTASATTADGGNWLTLSAQSGTAPGALQVGIIPANLPNGAQVAGTFVGQVVLQTDGDRTTIPVTVTVGDSVFRQISPLSFTKAYAGANPPPQVITAASTGANFQFFASAVDSTGGSWLTISPGGSSGVQNTPRTITVSANPASSLAAGTYTAEIILIAADGTQTSVIPVSLTVAPSTVPFFDQTSGALTFSMQTAGTAPPSKGIPIRNAGSGTLNWTASASTADGGSWLTLSAQNGTAPSTLVATVDPTYLPGQGLVAGTFVGQVVLQTNGDTTTVPVTFTVGTSVFTSQGSLSFTKAYAGANPPPQVITAASTGANFQFFASAVDSTGGSWLTISPGGSSGVQNTPRTITVSANPASSLAAGTYTAEIILIAADGTQASVIPVFLTVGSVTTTSANPTFTPGTGTYTAAQTVTIADSTPGATIYYTTDGTTPTTSSAQYSGPITVSSNAVLKAVAIATGSSLSGVATATYTFIAAIVSPANLSFGSQGTGTASTPKSITISNPGANALTGFTFSLYGTNATDFSFILSGCDTVAAGGTCTVAVTFTPQSSGSRSATLSISYSGTGSSQTVALSGTGTAASTVITLTPNLTSIIYGQALSVAASLSGTPVPSGTLTYQLDGSAAQTVPLSSGAATLALGILPAGSHALAVSYPGNALYGSASQTLSFTVAKAVLTATAVSTSRAYGQANPTFTYSVTGFVNGDTLAAVGGSATLATTATPTSQVGTYPITFATNSLAATNYTIAPVFGTLTITQAPQNIMFAALPNQTYGATLTLAATASSGLPVSYSAKGPATLTGSLLTIAGTGTVTVTASQPGDVNHSAATPVTQSFTASAASQTITFTGLPSSVTYGAGPFVLSATASSGLPVTYSVSGPATLANSTLTLTGTGTVTVTASQGGNNDYTSATPVILTLVVTSAGQTVTFTGLPATAIYGSAGPYTLHATASSGLPITYNVTGPAVLSGAVLTVTGAGTVSVTASQAGDSTYSAASPVTQTIVIGAANQTIFFTGLPATATFGSAGPYSLAATASSGLPISYTVSGPAVLSGSLLTITGAGTVSVTAAQQGNANYNAAPSVTLSITVSMASQTIAFTGLPNTAVFGQAGPYTLTAVASSGLQVSYSVSGPATLSGSVLTVTSPGTVAVTASQAGNAVYNSAAPVTQTIVISAAPNSGTVELVSTGTVTKQQDGSYTADVLVINLGTATAQNVVLTNVSVGAASGSPLPQTLGVLQPGAYARVTVSVPGTAGVSGSRIIEKLAGTYDGGTFGGSLRVTLP